MNDPFIMMLLADVADCNCKYKEQCHERIVAREELGSIDHCCHLSEEEHKANDEFFEEMMLESAQERALDDYYDSPDKQDYDMVKQ
jgi:hypothetical protein